MPIQVGTEDSACSIWNDLGASMLATYLFRGRRWRERQEAGPLLAPAHLRHHEALRGGVSVFQLAANMGTSVEMLEDFYGKKRMRDPKMATEVTKNRGTERIR